MCDRYDEMNMGNRLRGVGLAFGICLITAPIAIVVTITLLPLWSWIESMFEIESMGHSGPAEWCYLTSYLIALACAALIWSALRRRARIEPDHSLDRK